MKLSVIIVNYNTKEITLDCLRSLEKNPFRSQFEVILVDNASSDGSEASLSKFRSSKFSYTFVRNDRNLGFAKANNIGLKKAKGEYCLLLNSDTLVLEDSLNDLYDFAIKHPDAGVIAPKLLNGDKTVQASVYKLPTIARTIKEYWLGQKGLNDKYVPPQSSPVSVEAVVAAAFLITPKAKKKVGLLDEKYFMYFEDLDYCRSVTKQGLKVYYLPKTKIVHLHGKSGENAAAHADQWKRLIPSSKIYHGLITHYIRWFIMRTSQARREPIILAIVLLALFFRLYYLNDNLFFGFEQGRDFLKFTEIASGDPTLIGPKTDIDGIFHGALSYYLPLPAFVLFLGSPYLVLASLIVIHAISVYFLHKFALSIGDKKFATFTALIYACSYPSIVYARWLSNPNLAPAFAIFVFYFLSRAKQNKINLVIAAMFWAFIFHIQVIAAMILILPVLFFVISKRVLQLKYAILSALTVLVVLSTYVAFNFINDNILYNGLINYFAELGGPRIFSLSEFYNQITDEFMPSWRSGAFILLSLSVFAALIDWRSYRSRLVLLLYFSAPIVFMILGVTPLRHLFILSPVFASLLLANLVSSSMPRLLKTAGLLLIILVIVASIVTILERLPESQRNYIYPAQATYLSDMTELIDYAYQDSNGTAFSYDYYSIPYWHNDSWRYLFGWYGLRKYGSLPAENRTAIFYVFIEPDEIQPKYQEDWYKKMNSESRVLESRKSGKLILEKRQVL